MRITLAQWRANRCDTRWCWRRHRETIWPLNNEPRVQRCLRHQWRAEDYEANSERFIAARGFVDGFDAARGGR